MHEDLGKWQRSNSQHLVVHIFEIMIQVERLVTLNCFLVNIVICFYDTFAVVKVWKMLFGHVVKESKLEKFSFTVMETMGSRLLFFCFCSLLSWISLGLLNTWFCCYNSLYMKDCHRIFQKGMYCCSILFLLQVSHRSNFFGLRL